MIYVSEVIALFNMIVMENSYHAFKCDALYREFSRMAVCRIEVSENVEKNGPRAK